MKKNNGENSENGEKKKPFSRGILFIIFIILTLSLIYFPLSPSPSGLSPSTETYAPLVRHAIKNPSYHFLIKLSENMIQDDVARPGLLLAFMKLYCQTGDVESCVRICYHLNQRGLYF